MKLTKKQKEKIADNLIKIENQPYNIGSSVGGFVAIAIASTLISSSIKSLEPVKSP